MIGLYGSRSKYAAADSLPLPAEAASTAVWPLLGRNCAQRPAVPGAPLHFLQTFVRPAGLICIYLCTVMSNTIERDRDCAINGAFDIPGTTLRARLLLFLMRCSTPK